MKRIMLMVRYSVCTCAYALVCVRVCVCVCVCVCKVWVRLFEIHDVHQQYNDTVTL